MSASLLLSTLAVRDGPYPLLIFVRTAAEPLWCLPVFNLSTSRGSFTSARRRTTNKRLPSGARRCSLRCYRRIGQRAPPESLIILRRPKYMTIPRRQLQCRRVISLAIDSPGEVLATSEVGAGQFTAVLRTPYPVQSAATWSVVASCCPEANR
jgi:hypothetical protein